MYRFCDLQSDVEKLNILGAERGVIGHTENGTEIPYVFLGKKNAPSVLVVASVHAREHITSKLVMQQALFYLQNKVKIEGGLYLVPMLNIDGVRLCQEGVDFLTEEKKKQFLIRTNGSRDFSLWKANINAVDLNTNFDAHWGSGKQNLFFPSPWNYVGKAPMSESETKALAQFAQRVKADYTISYHAKGEIIFWEYFQKNLRKWRDYRYARFVSHQTGYPLVGQTDSAGGFKDWCIEKLQIPALTIEVGNDKFQHPFPYSDFGNILEKNLFVPQKLVNTLVKESKKADDREIYERGAEGGRESL